MSPKFFRFPPRNRNLLHVSPRTIFLATNLIKCWWIVRNYWRKFILIRNTNIKNTTINKFLVIHCKILCTYFLNFSPLCTYKSPLSVLGFKWFEMRTLYLFSTLDLRGFELILTQNRLANSKSASTYKSRIVFCLFTLIFSMGSAEQRAINFIECWIENINWAPAFLTPTSRN